MVGPRTVIASLASTTDTDLGPAAGLGQGTRPHLRASFLATQTTDSPDIAALRSAAIAISHAPLSNCLLHAPLLPSTACGRAYKQLLRLCMRRSAVMNRGRATPALSASSQRQHQRQRQCTPQPDAIGAPVWRLSPPEPGASASTRWDWRSSRHSARRHGRRWLVLPLQSCRAAAWRMSSMGEKKGVQTGRAQRQEARLTRSSETGARPPIGSAGGTARRLGPLAVASEWQPRPYRQKTCGEAIERQSASPAGPAV